MSYQLIKNTDWKDVEINGENKQIPNDWEYGLLTNYLDFQEGPGILAKDFRESGIPLLRIESIKGIETTLNGCNYLDENMVTKKWNHFKIKENDILLSASGTLGVISKVKKEHEGAIVYTGIIRFRVKDKTKQEFIPYLLNSDHVLNKLKKNANSSILSHFGPKDLKVLEMPLPSIQEQSFISSILSKQEYIISNIEKLIEKNEIIFNELSEQLLSGDLRLKENNGTIIIHKNPKDNWKEVEVNGKMKRIPSDWCVNKIKAISKVCTGNTPSTKEESFWTNQEGFKWISTPDFRIKKNGYINSFTRLLTSEGKKKARICPKDTLLVSCIATIGEVGLLSEDSSFNQQINAILPNEMVSTRYLQYFFTINKQDFINYAPESVVKIVNKELFEIYEVYFCSNYEQTLIENMLFDLENKIVSLKKLLANEKEKFEWLLDNLLSGNYLVKEIKK